MLAPSAFEQHIGQEVYTEARLVASKKIGVLRFLPVVLILSALLVVAGMTVMFSGSVRTMVLLIKGLAAIITALCLTVAFLLLIPEHIKNVSEKDFQTFDELSNRVTVTMTADEMTMRNERMTRRVEYAKIKWCVEKDERFIIITDDDHVVVLEKSCFKDPDNTIAFFRDVFARRYSR